MTDTLEENSEKGLQAGAPAVTAPPTWEDFRAVPGRLTLSLSSFVYALEYVPTFLDDEQRKQAATYVSQCVVNALATEPECLLTQLRVANNPAQIVEAQTESEGAYFTISFLNPVFDFALQMGPTTFQLIKSRTTLQNLLLTTRVWKRITEQLFPTALEPGLDGPLPSAFVKLGIPLRPVRISFNWQYRLAIGTHLSSEDEATNAELFGRLARVDVPTGASSADYPLATLGAEGLRRGDLTFGYTKVLEGRRRQLWIQFEGPWNVTGKDIDVAVTYRVGEESALETEDLSDFRTPFLAFLRDEILRSFFQDLFNNVNVTSRP